MAEIDLHLHDMNAAELVALAAGIASALKGNPNFPDASPTPEALLELTEQLESAGEAFRRQNAVLNEARMAVERATDALRAAIADEANYVQERSGGAISKILSANLQVAEESGVWPFNRIGQVENLSASMGDQPGEIDLSWDPVPRAVGYEIEIAYDLNGEGPWEQCGATTQSKLTIEKLSNRTRYWFRVHAVSERGDGEWSDPVTRFAR